MFPQAVSIAHHSDLCGRAIWATEPVAFSFNNHNLSTSSLQFNGELMHSSMDLGTLLNVFLTKLTPRSHPHANRCEEGKGDEEEEGERFEEEKKEKLEMK